MRQNSRPDSGICVPVQCRVSWLRRLSGAKRVQAYHQCVDVQRDRGTNGLRAVLIEQDDVEIEKKFKGKVPLTVCRLTGAGKAAFSGYSERMRALLKSNGMSG